MTGTFKPRDTSTPLPFRGGAGGGDSRQEQPLGRAPTPTPPLKGRGLKPHDTDRRIDAQPAQGRGKEWGLPAGKIEQLQSHARNMRNDPTEPEKRLWSILSRSQLGGFKFRRQVVIGSAIADFLCPQKGLIVEVDGDTHGDAAADQMRTDRLEKSGYVVVRVTNEDAMHNLDGVAQMLLAKLHAMPDRRVVRAELKTPQMAHP